MTMVQCEQKNRRKKTLAALKTCLSPTSLLIPVGGSNNAVANSSKEAAPTHVFRESFALVYDSVPHQISFTTAFDQALFLVPRF